MEINKLIDNIFKKLFGDKKKVNKKSKQPSVFEIQIEMLERMGINVDGYGYEPIEQIVKSLQNGVDITPYINADSDWEKMKTLRFAMQAGIDIAKFGKFIVKPKPELDGLGVNNYDDFNDRVMYTIQHELYKMRPQEYMTLDEMIEESEFRYSRYTPEQRRMLELGFEDGLDVKQYLDPALSGIQMYLLYIGLNDNIDISKYADPRLDWRIMKDLIDNEISNKKVNK